MTRLVLVLGMLLGGMAGCASNGSQRFSFHDGCGTKRCARVFCNKCNPCAKVAYRGCNRCEKTAFQWCNCCNKIAFGRCNQCERVASQCCSRCNSTAFGSFGRHHDYTSSNSGATHETRYYTESTQESDGYQTGSQSGYESAPGYRSSTASGVYLTSSQPSSIDSTFVRETAIANIANVEWGRLALRNASNTEVRNIGQSMIDNHGQALSNLEAVAMRMNLKVPDDLDPQHAQVAQRLSALTASEFDRQFIDSMVRDHRETVARFEARAASAPANEIQSFAIETLPRMRHLLQRALDIQARIRG